MKSRFTISLLALSLFFIRSAAQSSSENVSFDNYTSASDNDLVNWFSGGNGLTQITSSGITGGCLTTPDSISWGNDNANYCFKYVAGTPNATSVCFKYDTAMTSLPSYARCATIWLAPQADWNHYIVASVSPSEENGSDFLFVD